MLTIPAIILIHFFLARAFYTCELTLNFARPALAANCAISAIVLLMIIPNFGTVAVWLTAVCLIYGYIVSRGRGECTPDALSIDMAVVVLYATSLLELFFLHKGDLIFTQSLLKLVFA